MTEKRNTQLMLFLFVCASLLAEPDGPEDPPRYSSDAPPLAEGREGQRLKLNETARGNVVFTGMVETQCISSLQTYGVYVWSVHVGETGNYPPYRKRGVSWRWYGEEGERGNYILDAADLSGTTPRRL